MDINISGNNPFPYLFTRFSSVPELKTIVVIPVKDEEEYIYKTLLAFAKQVDAAGAALNVNEFELLILANNCSDRSVQIIQDFQQQHPQLPVYLEEIELEEYQANIGFVRKILMDAAYQRLCQNGGGIIFTTDADTEVAPNWIAQTQLEIEQGADAVGGRIFLYPHEVENLDHATAALHFKDEEYHLLMAELEGKILDTPHDPLPRHHQHFNGSFAITTSCYAKAGGSPEVPHLEDCAFFERLEKLDAKVRHSHLVTVQTSARCVGRTEIGLSHQLNEWRNMSLEDVDLFVESGYSVKDRLELKNRLRQLWSERHHRDFNFFHEIHHFGAEVPHEEFLEHLFYESSFFGAFYAEFLELQHENWQQRYPAVHIEHAIHELKTILQEEHCQHFSQTSIL